MSSEKETAPATHQPYVPDNVTMPEFTWPAVLVGAVLGIIFGASSLYLVLKVGMTVSASIPVAVLSITLFRWLGNTFGIRAARPILENNIVQTTGSAGESIAFGVGVTMPTMLLIGFDMEWPRVLVVSVLGGLLGILMMIPLRRACSSSICTADLVSQAPCSTRKALPAPRFSNREKAAAPAATPFSLGSGWRSRTSSLPKGSTS